ncbi:hypothetical protein [Allostreptomyces psammosilenae]|uniref:DUF3558 domain-containing protein n=1 Tax=Allostreptomyces psammosilenae TaxID=1892865 RepID=A0A853AAS1_9ACTN|nr:hypothetical protein [Allostreptomyces psammosilenae]NYI07721.1 hypothetical protein [Allostreptomyces psammosilenae]
MSPSTSKRRGRGVTLSFVSVLLLAACSSGAGDAGGDPEATPSAAVAPSDCGGAFDGPRLEEVTGYPMTLATVLPEYSPSAQMPEEAFVCRYRFADGTMVEFRSYVTSTELAATPWTHPRADPFVTAESGEQAVAAFVPHDAASNEWMRAMVRFVCVGEAAGRPVGYEVRADAEPDEEPPVGPAPGFEFTPEQLLTLTNRLAVEVAERRACANDTKLNPGELRFTTGGPAPSPR